MTSVGSALAGFALLWLALWVVSGAISSALDDAAEWNMARELEAMRDDLSTFRRRDA